MTSLPPSRISIKGSRVEEKLSHKNCNNTAIFPNDSRMSDEEYEYDYGSDGEYDYGSDQGENDEAQGGNDTLIEIENSFYGKFLYFQFFIQNYFMHIY